MIDILKSKGLLTIAVVCITITYFGSIEPNNMAENDRIIEDNINININ